MPKNTPPRAIDERKTTGAAFVGGGSGSGGGGVTDHGLLSGLTDDDHLQYHTDERGDLRYVPLARTVTAGNGLTGGGALSANISLALASSTAGAGLAYSAGVLSVNPGEGLEIETDNIGLASTVAGAGLAYSAGVLSVTPGEGLEIETDAIGLAASVAGAALSYNAGVLAVVPGEGLEIETDAIGLKSTVAGNGLTYTAGVLDVAVANTGAAGLSVEANAVRLTSSADPDNSAAILATTTAGLLTLRNGAFRQAAQSQATFASGFAGSGWRVDYGITTTGKASAEFDDLTIRGRMRVYELLIQQIRATNGSLFVSSSSKVVSVTTAANPAWTVNGVQLTFNGQPATFNAQFYTITTAAPNDSDRSLYHGFLYGDLVAAQQVRWNGAAFDGVMLSRMEVTRVDSLTSYGAALYDGDAPAAGYDYVRRGNTVDPSRRGAIYLTSDDAAAPFIDIVDGIQYHTDWNSATVKRVRLGKLTGISDSDFGGPLDGYGLYGNNVFLKGRMVITGGSLGGLAAADVNANTTTIDGGKITANSITADQIAANTITTSLLNFTPVLAGNVVASINATTEGLKIAANLIRIDGTTTFSAGYNPSTKIAAGGAAADVNANVTTISGGKITTNSIAADKLNVTDLSAIGATIGGWGIISNQINSTNIALYSGASARLEVGTETTTAGMAAGDSTSSIVSWAGATYANRAAAPYRLTLAGSLASTDATFGSSVKVDTTGVFITPPSAFSDSYGYKFKFGTTVAAGLFGTYTSGSTSAAWVLNNKSNTSTGIVDTSADSTIALIGAAGSTKTSQIDLRAERIVGGVSQFTGLSLVNTSTLRKAIMYADTFVVTPTAGSEYAVWHSNNDGPGSGLNADTLDGYHGSEFARTAASNTFDYETTFAASVNFQSYQRFSTISDAPAYQSGYGLLYLLDGGNGHYQFRIKIRSADGTKYIDKEITTT